MVRKIQVSAKMTIGQLIRNMDEFFFDPSENTITNFEILSSDGSVSSLHKLVEEVSEFSSFKDCEVIIKSDNIFEISQDFEKQTGLYVHLDCLENSLLI
jgi:predicted HAD superfamily phosphohydrolase